MTEVRSVSSTGGEKGTKPERYDLIPVGALATVARLYGEGAKKYAEHNWRKGYDWSKSYAALQRHANQFWAGEDIDEEMRLPHLASVVFHAFTLMTFMEEHRQFDDRFRPEDQGFTPEELADREARLAALREQLTNGAPVTLVPFEPTWVVSKESANYVDGSFLNNTKEATDIPESSQV